MLRKKTSLPLHSPAEAVQVYIPLSRTEVILIARILFLISRPAYPC